MHWSFVIYAKSDVALRTLEQFLVIRFVLVFGFVSAEMEFDEILWGIFEERRFFGGLYYGEEILWGDLWWVLWRSIVCGIGSVLKLLL
jgi:hypothetical protein